MKKFLFRLLATAVMTAIILEIVLRVFHLAGNTLPEVNLDGNLMLKPHAEGFWIRGGMGEIRSHYSINNQGWNSLVDYDTIDQRKTSIALIGDSYLQGLHVDVENSIGRILESRSADYLVHEYGRDGSNMVDFQLVYQEWVQGRYDFVFVLISERNLNEFQANFMDQGASVPPESFIRKIYNASHLIRYMNINHGLLVKLSSLFLEGPESLHEDESASKNVTDRETAQKTREEIFKKFDASVVFLYQPDGIDSPLMEGKKYLSIDHQIQPISYGFDSHWNLNGRINCANTLHKYLQAQIQTH